MSKSETTENHVPTVRLTDDGLETPEHLVGATGRIQVEKPHLDMAFEYVGDGVPEYSELTVFPTTGKTGNVSVPEGHIRIEGTLYRIVDDRDLNECPHCGSDKIPAATDDPKCYGCDERLEAIHNEH